jgi:hypothetical protein
LLDVGEGTTAQLYQSVSGDFERFNRYLCIFCTYVFKKRKIYFEVFIFILYIAMLLSICNV